jgi:hypothetical protein
MTGFCSASRIGLLLLLVVVASKHEKKCVLQAAGCVRKLSVSEPNEQHFDESRCGPFGEARRGASRY